jgi:hypothetical protein
MQKAMLISLDVVVISFIISFMVAALIKVLMSGIRFFFNNTAKKPDNI